MNEFANVAASIAILLGFLTGFYKIGVYNEIKAGLTAFQKVFAWFQILVFLGMGAYGMSFLMR